MKNVDHIITAKDYSREEGADGTVAGRLKKMQQAKRLRGIIVQIREMDAPRGNPVYAQINQGAWIAPCECGGAEFVSPDEPIFFCWGCVNRENNGYVRKVIFPEAIEDIERLVLARKVDDLRGVTDKDRAFLAKPLLAFTDENGVEQYATRSWIPGETVQMLEEQNRLIEYLKTEAK